MKKVISLIAYLCCLSACKNESASILQSQVVDPVVKEIFSDGFNTVRLITIDSVVYIMCDNYKGGISITPKLKK